MTRSGSAVTRSGSAVTRPVLWLFGPAGVWLAIAAAGVIGAARDPNAWGPVDRRGGGLAGSEACGVCHPGQFESWRRSFHRTMTQPAAGAAVLAPFAGESLVSQGFRATMTRSAFGVPHVQVEGEGGVLLDVDVALTVGSHRYQQYVARIDRGGGPGELWRLPVAWHLGARRWIPMNAAFLEPEGEPGDAEDCLRHLSRWNDNCVLCHNTEPVPGLSDRAKGTGPEGQAWFASAVGEFGIACEACHGPAGAHVERQADPGRRLLGGAGDPAVAHPGRLTPEGESGLCGRCHGNRIAADVAAVLRDGDGFLPGELLASVSRPIFADSRVGGSDETPFAARFWPDGTPRLSAYEYQGLLQSPCHQEGAPGGLGCNHCHDMHGDDPDMQVRAGRKGQAACDGCHTLDASHGGHASVDCQGCHMPRITYGLLEGMISHRVTSPDPGAWVGRHDQPDACTQCHVDRSRRWAAEQLPRLGFAAVTTGEEASEEGWAPRVLLDLHGGDPVQRGLAAHALARPEVPVPAATRLQWLVDALEDGYPAVRWMAWRAMQELAGPELAGLLADYDPHAEASLRVPAVDALRARLGPGPLTEAQRLALEARQDQTLLSIGE